jgi:hypothetical protein
VPEYKVDAEQKQDVQLQALLIPIVAEAQAALLEHAITFGARGLDDYLTRVSFEIQSIYTISTLPDGSPDFGQARPSHHWSAEYDTFKEMSGNLIGHPFRQNESLMHQTGADLGEAEDEEDNGGLIGMIGRHEFQETKYARIDFEKQYNELREKKLDVKPQFMVTGLTIRATTVPFEAFPDPSSVSDYFTIEDVFRSRAILSKIQETKRRKAEQALAELDAREAIERARLEREAAERELIAVAERSRIEAAAIEAARIERETKMREAFEGAFRARAEAIRRMEAERQLRIKIEAEIRQQIEQKLAETRRIKAQIAKAKRDKARKAKQKALQEEARKREIANAKRRKARKAKKLEEARKREIANVKRRKTRKTNKKRGKPRRKTRKTNKKRGKPRRR